MRYIILIIFIILAFCARASDSLNCTGKLDRDGNKHGVWVCKNNKGKLIRKERFKHGNLNSWILYNAKGQMVQSRDKKGKIRKFNPCGC